MPSLLPTLWAMKPEALSLLLDDCRKAEFQTGDRPEASMEARRNGAAEGPSAEPYTQNGSVAVIPVNGPLSKNGLTFWGITFMASMRGLSAALRCAEADPAVSAILLDVDSPGGTVDGIEELADTVAAVNAAKPVYAYADGLMASAGYWLSCHAREIAAPSTAEVGSIGVVLMQREISRALDTMGVSYSVITAGHYKAAGNPVQPLTEEMRAYLQSGVDEVYELFLQHVERGRGVSREKALAMADGRVFLAGEALKTGLVDRICSKEAFINHIKTSIREATMPMTLAQFAAQHPEAAAELRAEAQAEALAETQQTLQTQLGEARSAVEGARTAEQERVLTLAASLLGEAATESLRSLAASGVTAEQVASLRGVFLETARLEARVDKQQEMLDAMKTAHDHKLNPLGAEVDPQNFEHLVASHREKQGCSHGEAIASVARTHPEAHRQWLKSKEGGK